MSLFTKFTKYNAIDTSPDVRKIMPPKLDKANVAKRIICHRPVRTGGFRAEIEVIKTINGENKIIAHNYGHGGSGWTLAPGSASYVNDLLINSTYPDALAESTPIIVIGAGVLGLFTAYDLYNKGYKTITVVADKFKNLTSHKAGGLLAPTSMDSTLNIQNVITKIGIDAYKFYELIAKNKNNDFKNGAFIMPIYCMDRVNSGLEPYVGEVMNPAKDVILDFGNGTTRKMIVYEDGIFIDVAEIMKRLTRSLRKNGVRFMQKKISSFDDIGSKFIVNCSGLGAREINKDINMVSIQGHLIMLKNQNPEHLKYMLLGDFGEGETKLGQRIKRSFYFLPKRWSGAKPHNIGVIGGTYIENLTSKAVNDEEFNRMIEKAKNFYGIT